MTRGFYYETQHGGKWWPRWSKDKPLQKDGRQWHQSGAYGPPIRAVTEVPEDAPEDLTLDDMRVRWSPREAEA